MKFLFGIWGLTHGGAERALANFCNILVENGHEVHLYIRNKEKDEYTLDKRVVIHRGYNYSTISSINNIRKKENRFVLYYYLLSLKMFFSGSDKKRYISSIIDKVKPDFIIPFLLGAQIEFYHAISISNYKPINVFTVRSYQTGYEKQEQIIQRFLEKKADYVWCQTNEQKNFYENEIQKKSFVVENAISDSFIDSKIDNNGDIRSFIAVGRLTAQKNYLLMLNAFKKIVEEYPDCFLDIYGNGELYEKLVIFINNNGLSNNVMLHKRKNNIQIELTKSHAFLMSSNYEGMPNSLMEAMAVGLPCICTDCLSGPRELLGKNRGFLVPCNDIEKYYLAIKYLINHKKEAMARANNASDYIKNNFNKSVIYKKLIKECVLMKRNSNQIRQKY